MFFTYAELLVISSLLSEVANASVTSLSFTSLHVIPNLYIEMYFIYNITGLNFLRKSLRQSQVLKARGWCLLVDGACDCLDQAEANTRGSQAKDYISGQVLGQWVAWIRSRRGLGVDAEEKKDFLFSWYGMEGRSFSESFRICPSLSDFQTTAGELSDQNIKIILTLWSQQSKL